MEQPKIKTVPWTCPSCGRYYENISVAAVRTKKHCQADGCIDKHEDKVKKHRLEREKKKGWK